MINVEPWIRRCRSLECTDGTILSLERADTHGLVTAFRPFLKSLDEGPARCYSCGVAIEKQELLGVGAGEGGPDDIPILDANNLVDILASAWPGSC